MPVGNIAMSDGRCGAVPPKQLKAPEALTHPYDGAPGFHHPDVPHSRFANQDSR
eukprot:SAG22_NODE_35_length_27276_cov_20.395849_21_plen_54_part_00